MHYGPMSSEIDATRYPDLRKWVVGCLSSHKKPNEIIFQLCRRTGWDWGQAKKFVEQVVEMDQRVVHQKRMPLLLVFGLIIMVTGILHLIAGINDLQETISNLPASPDLMNLIGLILDVKLLASNPWGFFLRSGVVLGPIIFLGGAWGVWSAVKSAMTGEGDDLLKSGTQP